MRTQRLSLRKIWTEIAWLAPRVQGGDTLLLRSQALSEQADRRSPPHPPRPSRSTTHVGVLGPPPTAADGAALGAATW